MDLAQLKKKGGVIADALVPKEVEWKHADKNGKPITDKFTVHVRRLRAKLGPEYEQLIGTVRNVGYRFDPPKDRRAAQAADAAAHEEAGSAPVGSTL